MKASERLAQRYKAATKGAPSQLLSLVRRSVTGRPEYAFDAENPGSPHTFKYKSGAFTIWEDGLKHLLREGLTKIRSEDRGSITLHFAPTGKEDAPDTE